jgi:hypothetical protein
MPTAAATYALKQAIQAYVQATINIPLFGGAANAYKTVNIGAVKDFTDAWPVLEILGHTGVTKRHAVGGKIRDITAILLRSIVDETNSNFSEENIDACRDALTGLWHATARLNATNGVVDSRLNEQEKWDYVPQNGQWWRAHECVLECTYEYNVTITP